MDGIKKSYLVIAALALILLTSIVFTVHEGQRALVLVLGKVMKDHSGTAIVDAPGLHFKYPLIANIKRFDVRLQTLDIKSSRIMTEEKKEVVVDYYVKWRINNVEKYFVSTSGFAQRAERLLEQQLNDGLRAEFGRRTIQDVVAESRTQIMTTLRERAAKAASRLGIAVIDVRLKGIDLPKAVSSAVYERMRVERERVASEHRAEGKSKGEAIRANADAKVAVILAVAKADAARTRAEGDAKATRIYADAYTKDPNFFEFYRRMTAYEIVFSNKHDMLVVNPKSDFFKYFDKAKG